MTAQQLIDLLNKYSPDTRVVLDSCEFGYDDVTEVVEQPLLIGVNNVPRPYAFGRGERIAPAEYGAGEHDAPGRGEPHDELAVRVSGRRTR
ncbi:hypothetical protein [Ralstonia pseudosolanacearum]